MLPADAADETRWRLLLGYATALTAQQDVAAARTAVEEILDDEPDRAHDGPGVDDAHRHQADGRGFDRGDRDRRGGPRRWQSLGDDRGAADALRSRGRTYMFLGDLEAADRDFSEALDAFREAGDRRGEAWALQNLASIAFFRNDSARAEDRLDRSVTVFPELGDYGGLNWCEGIRAWVRFTQGRLEEAEALAYEQLSETETTGNRWVAGILYLLLANLALWRGRLWTRGGQRRGDPGPLRRHRRPVGRGARPVPRWCGPWCAWDGSTTRSRSSTTTCRPTWG